MVDRIKICHPSPPGNLQPQNSVQVPVSANNNNQNSSQTSAVESCPENGKIPLGFANISAPLGMLKHSKLKTGLASNVGHSLRPFKLETIKGVSEKPIFLQLGQRVLCEGTAKEFSGLTFLQTRRKYQNLSNTR